MLPRFSSLFFFTLNQKKTCSKQTKSKIVSHIFGSHCSLSFRILVAKVVGQPDELLQKFHFIRPECSGCTPNETGADTDFNSSLTASLSSSHTVRGQSV